MSRNAVAGLLGGLLSLGVAGAALADSDGLDDKLENRVEGRLDKNKLGSLNVDVTAGVVTLTGEVASSAEKARAESLARAEGAKRVVNNLEVDTDKAAARITERANEKKEAIEEKADRQKEAVDRQAEAAKERLEKGTTAGTVTDRDRDRDRRVVVDADKNRAERAAYNGNKDIRARDGSNNNVVDPWVTTKVKTKILADELLDKSDINVDTDKDGVVTLKGYVPTAAAETRALEIARTTEGVRKVVDRLDVKVAVTR